MKRGKKARAALKKIKNIAGRQIRDIEREFISQQKNKYQDLFIIINKILEQKKLQDEVEQKRKEYKAHLDALKV
ncbi:MAG TPA: hypothetical protein EYP69_00245, partial [Bacteroidales bacterium]|nr:hypothetical protein [Bacteroidales bacterium]